MDTCCPKKEILSQEEEVLLRQMRLLKGQFRALAREDPGRAALRQEFNRCRDLLRQANRAKLVRLGHEP